MLSDIWNMARVIQFGCSTHKKQFIGLMIRGLNIVMPVNLNIVWLLNINRLGALTYVMNIVSLKDLLEGFFNRCTETSDNMDHQVLLPLNLKSEAYFSAFHLIFLDNIICNAIYVRDNARLAVH